MAKESDKKKPRLSLMDLATMAKETPATKWLVDGVMVEGQPMVIAGPPKSLKTTLSLELAVSLGTGTSFLGKFPIAKPHAVAVFSGESGQATVHETIQRIIKSRGKSPNDCMVHCGFTRPRLSSASDRNELRRLISTNGIEVVIVDPLYLSLLDGNKSVSASNLYEVGAVLAAVAEACSWAGAMIVLVHHTTKGSAAKSRNATLNDLAFAGVGDFARQWLLVNRAAEYTPGSGHHELILSVGGSAGHSSQWRLDIDEGPCGKKRTWSVDVQDNVACKSSKFSKSGVTKSRFQGLAEI